MTQSNLDLTLSHTDYDDFFEFMHEFKKHVEGMNGVQRVDWSVANRTTSSYMTITLDKQVQDEFFADIVNNVELKVRFADHAPKYGCDYSVVDGDGQTLGDVAAWIKSQIDVLGS